MGKEEKPANGMVFTVDSWGMRKWTGFSAQGRRGDRDDSCHHL